MNYTVTVTDENGCSRKDEVEVMVQSMPRVNVVTNNAHCGKADGSITFNFQDHPDRPYLVFSISGRMGLSEKLKMKLGPLLLINSSRDSMMFG